MSILDITFDFFDKIIYEDWCQNNSEYWLRTPGLSASINTDYVMTVNWRGEIWDRQVHEQNVGVRPAMWIRIE